jgi:ATP-binding cassette subfamily F protein 3
MAKTKVESPKPVVDSKSNAPVLEQTPIVNSNPSAVNNQNKEQQKELQKLQKQFSKLESSLNELNQQKTNTEAELANPGNYSDRKKFLELEERYKTVQQKLTAANKEYEMLFEKIMQLE